MVDYRTHVAALQQFQDTLAQSTFADAQTATLRDRHLNDVAQSPGMAMLGAMIDHLIAHASSDGTELMLLERAAALWKEGLALYATLGTFRDSLERALADPSNPQAVNAFNTAAANIHPLLVQVKSKNSQIQSLKNEVHTFGFLPPHPRQLDEPLTAWSWGDVMLARRTDAFARTVRAQAFDTRTSAFAFGVLSGYGANACGSAYLGQVVGGPRRAHRHRDRVARNTLGSWFAAGQPIPTLTAIANQIKVEAPTLPTDLENLIASSLTDTYDTSRTPALPNLQLGHQRLIRHLELLDTFAVPAAPVPPIEPFLTRLYADLTVAHVPAVPQQVGVPQAAGAGSGSGSGITPQAAKQPDALTDSDAPDSTTVDCGAFWEAVGLSLLFVLGGWFYCVIKWANDEHCPLTDDIGDNFDDAFPDGVYVGPEHDSNFPQALTSTQLGNAANVEQTTTLIGHLFDTQCLIWEALNKAADFLSTHGLIYPDGRLGRPRYKQFLRVPSTPQGTWPQRPEPNANRLHRYPTTGTELPAAGPSAYAANVPPDVFLNAREFGLELTAAGLSTAVWRQMADGIVHAPNYDLDADRGFHHPCWRARGSITDNPIDVVVLDYLET